MAAHELAPTRAECGAKLAVRLELPCAGDQALHRSLGQQPGTALDDAVVGIDAEREDGYAPRPGLEEGVGHPLDLRRLHDRDRLLHFRQRLRSLPARQHFDIRQGAGGGMDSIAKLRRGLERLRGDHPEARLGHRRGQLDELFRALVLGHPVGPEEVLGLGGGRLGGFRKARDHDRLQGREGLACAALPVVASARSGAEPGAPRGRRRAGSIDAGPGAPGRNRGRWTRQRRTPGDDASTRSRRERRSHRCPARRLSGRPPWRVPARY